MLRIGVFRPNLSKCGPVWFLKIISRPMSSLVTKYCRLLKETSQTFLSKVYRFLLMKASDPNRLLSIVNGPQRPLMKTIRKQDSEYSLRPGVDQIGLGAVKDHRGFRTEWNYKN